jgi:hypothetical protein
MKKISTLILILPFAVILILPAIQKELKLIHVAPLKSVYNPSHKLDFTGRNWFSGDFQISFEKYLKDNAGLRPLFVRIFNQYNYSVFNMPSYGGVIIGKNNVLFQTGYIKPYTGEDFAGSSRIDSFFYRMKIVQHYLKQKNKYFLYVLAPDKVSIYPEIVPDKINIKRKDTTNYEVMVNCLNKYGINYIDFCSYFKAIRDTIRFPLFTRLGTHWSGSASSLAMDTIIQKIEIGKGVKIKNYSKLPGCITQKDLKFTDADLAQYMDLLIPLQSDKVYYPVYQFDTTVSRTEKLLLIGDSFCQSFWGFDNVFPRVFSDSSMFWGYYHIKQWPSNPSLSLEINFLYLDEYLDKADIIVLESVDLNFGLLGFGFVDDLYHLITHPENKKEYLTSRQTEDIILFSKYNDDQYTIKKIAEDNKITVDSAFHVFALKKQKDLYETRKIMY